MNHGQAVAFSGGQTSAYMLRKLADQQDISAFEILFCNTGLEHEKTLEFVHQVETSWALDVTWLEWTPDGPRKTVYADASRNGEPFRQLIEQRQMLPTPVARICTVNLKIRTMAAWLKRKYESWNSYVGIRWDEPRRWARIKPDCAAEEICLPLVEMKTTLKDVDTWWEQNDFKLEIPRYMGNCVGCYLKSRGRIEAIAEQAPEYLKWWVDAETDLRMPFRRDRPSYGGILHQVTIQGRLFEDDGSTLPCHCTE